MHQRARSIKRRHVVRVWGRWRAKGWRVEGGGDVWVWVKKRPDPRDEYNAQYLGGLWALGAPTMG